MYTLFHCGSLVENLAKNSAYLRLVDGNQQKTFVVRIDFAMNTKCLQVYPENPAYIVVLQAHFS